MGSKACTLPEDSAAMGFLTDCSTLDDLWRLRFWEYPLAMGEGSRLGKGWSEKPTIPSERQLLLLSDYGMKHTTASATARTCSACSATWATRPGSQLPQRLLTMSRSMDPAELFHLLRSGDRAALAQAITLVESTLPIEQVRAEELLERCLPSQDSLRIGITGPPGVGKSTLIDAFGIAADQAGPSGWPSSPWTQQPAERRQHSGDKTRMERLGAEPAASDSRPTASRGSLGGLARRTREAMVLCEAAGYDRGAPIETVGVGQSEAGRGPPHRPQRAAHITRRLWMNSRASSAALWKAPT